MTNENLLHTKPSYPGCLLMKQMSICLNVRLPFFPVLQILEFLLEQKLGVFSCIRFAYMVRKSFKLGLTELNKQSYRKENVGEIGSHSFVLVFILFIITPKEC